MRIPCIQCIIFWPPSSFFKSRIPTYLLSGIFEEAPPTFTQHGSSLSLFEKKSFAFCTSSTFLAVVLLLLDPSLFDFLSGNKSFIHSIIDPVFYTIRTITVSMLLICWFDHFQSTSFSTEAGMNFPYGLIERCLLTTISCFLIAVFLGPFFGISKVFFNLAVIALPSTIAYTTLKVNEVSKIKYKRIFCIPQHFFQGGS